MCVFLLAAGLSLLKTTGSEGARIGPVVLYVSSKIHSWPLENADWFIILRFVYLFTIAYCLGEGPVAFQYSAEVFPTIQREQGMAWAIFVNNTFGEIIFPSQTNLSYPAQFLTETCTAGILGLTFPRMRTVMTSTGACKSTHSHPWCNQTTIY